MAADGNNLEAGQFALSGSAQQFTGAGAPTKTGVAGIQLRNLSAANRIYIGYDNTVSATTGFPIEPGATETINILNPSALWLLGTAADRLAWLSLRP